MKAFIPSRAAEIIFAFVIGYFGVNHFLNAEAMGGIVPAYMPGSGTIWVYITGTGLVLAAIAILTGIQKALACYLLAAMLIIFVFTLHIKHFSENPGNALKDTAMAMGAILIGNRS
jgi:putative oxidoreductase